ncbi:MAG: sugar translocase [Negativicutes bacterium]|nr:sugar translocase [Negativicutes bacterium]
MRTKNSVRNVSFVLVGQLSALVMSFIERTVFIKILDASYLGVNGLFSNILMMLTLVELGIGWSIIYSLYKPIATRDEYKIQALMNLYAKAYKIIACIVFCLGISLTPFLDFLISDRPAIPHLELIYVLYVLNTTGTYLFAYKRSIIIADQKSYIISSVHYALFALRNIAQIAVLVITRNFILYVTMLIVFNIGENVIISLLANRIYPFLKKRKEAQLDKETKSEIFRNVGALIFHRMSGVVTNGTDNLVIAANIGVVWVGLYSNYYLIITTVTGVLGQIFSAISASVGNLNATEDAEKKYRIFKVVNFTNYWMTGICSICLWELLNPFILLWIGKEYLLDEMVVIVLVVNFYLDGMRNSTLTFKDAMGLFWQDRYKPVAQASINIVLSIILIKYIGIVGVFLGTLISKMATAFWVEPYVVHKYGFQKPQGVYYFRYFVHSVLVGISILAINFICSLVHQSDLIMFLFRWSLCLIVPNIVFWLAMRKTAEFAHVANILKAKIYS